jgi:lipooligosaccharide transport system ATP-binding protein
MSQRNGGAVVAASGLTKIYDGRPVVDAIDLCVKSGECFGILGPNGAGKTTTLRMLIGLSPPTAGKLEVLGFPIPERARLMRRRIGVVPQGDNLDPDFTVIENLSVYGRYFDLRKTDTAARIPELLAFAALESKATAAIHTLSGGMRRRLILARALINQPDLLVLDEPTTGLDPQARQLIWQRLRSLLGQGKTLILTTHYMEEAERLCDRIVVIDQGRVVAHDTLRGLYRLLPASNRLLVELEGPRDDGPWLDGLRAAAGVASVAVAGERLEIGLADLAEAAPRVLAWLRDGGHAYQHVRSERGDLEAVFLALTGKTLRDS